MFQTPSETTFIQLPNLAPSQDVKGRIIRALRSLPPLKLKGKSSPIFNQSEIEQLSEIKTYRGDYLFDPSKSDKFYQLVSMVILIRDGKANMVQRPTGPEIENTKSQMGMGFQKVIDYLTSEVWIFPEEAVHESPLINKFRDQIDLFILNQEQEPVVEEGNVFCVRPGCSSRRVVRNQAQTRGGDESTTVFLWCSECGKTWKKG